MTILQSLGSLNPYPIPAAALNAIAAGTGLDATAELSPENRESPAMKRAEGKVYLYLAGAPNVSQNGISFSFSAEERKMFRRIARSLFKEAGTDAGACGVSFGYKGENF